MSWLWPVLCVGERIMVSFSLRFCACLIIHLLGIPRVLEGTIPPHLKNPYSSDDRWLEYKRYLQTTRINVNVRQVFPKGFDPAQAVARDTRDP